MPAFRMSQYRIRPMARFMPTKQTFTDSLDCIFRYSTQLGIASSAGAAGQYQWRLNSLYDPFYTAVGNQPRYYDTLCTSSGPYSKYRVNRAQMRATFYNTNSSAASFGYVYGRISDSATLISPTVDVSYYSEGPDITSAMISMNGNDNCCAVFDIDVNIAKMFGARRAYELDELLADYNANPQDVVYVELGYRPADLTTTTTIQCTIEIVFHCTLTGLSIPSLSLSSPPKSLPLVAAAPAPSSVTSEEDELVRQLIKLRAARRD